MAIITENLSVDVLGIIITLLALLYGYLKWSFRYWKTRNIPYLEPSIPFGNLQPPYGRTMNTSLEIANMYTIAKARDPHAKYCGVYMLAKPSLILIDPDLIKDVLTKQFSYFTDRGIYTNEKDDPLSTNIFALGGIKWRHLRTKFTPTFTAVKLRGMFQTLTDCGDDLRIYVKEKFEEKETFDAKFAFTCYTTNVIGSCAFGLNCNSFKKSDSPFHHFASRVLERNTLAILEDSFANNFPNFARLLKITVFPRDAIKFFSDLVERTVTYREKNNVRRKDFLQMLIDIKQSDEKQENEHKGDGKVLTMKEIIAQCFAIFVAGSETSATTGTFALYEMAINQEIQDKVREELTRVLKKYNDQINYDSVNELNYMGQVVDETLRKYPPVPFITRECVETYKDPSLNLTIEKGISVVISINGLQNDGDNYENPDKFDPERFNEINKTVRHQYTYLPFGEGPRICIGQRFGLMQTRVGLANILKNYRVTLSEKQNFL